MRHAPAALAASVLVLAASLDAQAPPKATPKPVPTQKQSGAGITVQAGPEAPKGAAPADVEDLRLLSESGTDPFTLERLGLGAAQAKDLGKARIFFEKSWTLGHLPTAAYNLACVDAHEKKIDAAFANLDRALGAGFDDEASLKNDPDIAPLRSSPRWAGVVDRAARNRAAGDAAAVKEGIFVAPTARAAAVLVLLHDAASSPLAVSGPFVAPAQKRGLFVAAPRGPAKSADRKFGWGSADRAMAAVDAAVSEARKRAGDAKLPVYVVGVGRGGTEALTIVARTPRGAVAGVGSIGGPFDPGAAREATGLRGPRLVVGLARDADPARSGAFHRGVEALRKMGLSPVVSEWPGTGDGFPKDPSVAVADVLDGLRAPTGR